ncbi:hypothetical protein SAMN05444008_101444 [Cnuella takakiae]|uniref:HNH endonuclease n=1 Tax=Cnuella takakiae TaxID=1302690 RepID=A0A1M4TMJ5_9BACT|nr:hypothetical protein [Cnuella takakiae]OLY90766.1 hypothetical protein BUE76_01765 [Cnuella takakiae]SHE45625.1 hypothetical protein SAMN05444008_101444 [Cnuella takakiae]
MILINDIEPFEISSTYKTVSDLELDYKSKFLSGYKPVEVLIEALRKRKYRKKSTANTTEIEILNYLVKNFDAILLQQPQDLHKSILYFKNRGWQNYIHNGKKSTKFGIELLEAFGYSKKFRSQVKRGIWLAKQLNIKSCPYCNAQYTIVASGPKKKTIAKFQFDHFFAKDKYPYLSISLYNLIPSCANCNITKSKKDLNLKNHYHPYFLDFSKYFKFYLKFNPDPKKLTVSQVKSQNFEVELKPKHRASATLVEEHNSIYHVSGVFNRHNDVAEDLLMKAVIYTNHMQKAHLKIQGLFPDRITYLRYLIGNYSTPKDTLKRPLTKFIQDISEQLKLI